MRIGPIRPLKTPANGGGEASLCFERVRHAYGHHTVVNDLSFAIGGGELLCLLGPSGCGKTTTLRLAAGLDEPMAGVIRLNGAVVAGEGSPFVPPEKRGVGFLFQDYALFPHLKVLDNVCFGLAGAPRATQEHRAMAALKRVGMTPWAGVYPHTLSGGQRQRVGLARALAPEPRLMLLDEPFSGLDRRLRDEVRDQTLHVLKDSGVPTLMVTHDPEEAMFMADTIMLMRAGTVVQQGSPTTLYYHPNSAFSAEFFQEVNKFSGFVQKSQYVSTAFGTLKAPQDCDTGARVCVLIRPDALRLEAIADGDRPAVWARVLESRMLGRSSLIHLEADGPDGAPQHAHARVSGLYLPTPGETLAITLDPSQAFVFPDP